MDIEALINIIEKYYIIDFRNNAQIATMKRLPDIKPKSPIKMELKIHEKKEEQEVDYRKNKDIFSKASWSICFSHLHIMISG